MDNATMQARANTGGTWSQQWRTTSPHQSTRAGRAATDAGDASDAAADAEFAGDTAGAELTRGPLGQFESSTLPRHV